MRQYCVLIVGCASLFIGSLCEAQVAVRWNFDRNGDLQHWVVPDAERGVVMGGSLWLTLEPKETDAARVAMPSYQWTGDKDQNPHLLTSPPHLQLRARDLTQVRLKVLNLSSLTDFFLEWRTKKAGWGGADPVWGRPRQSRRCTLKADTKEWQEITCYVGHGWQGTLEQIALARSFQKTLRGDLWIAWIEIGKGRPAPVGVRPDVVSDRVVPKVVIPSISQSGFADAFKALDKCLIVDVPLYGFNYPVMSPGGYYAPGGWWQLDSSLALTGAMWANQHFAENVMRGFSEVQDPDGRIDLTGYFWIRGQVADLSSLPKFFEVAYAVARRTNDVKLRGEIYETMRKYLEWWLSPVKRDARTGLISGLGEETFGDRSQAPQLKHNSPDVDMEPMTLAPVDLNVEVAVGAMYTARLAAALGKGEDARHFSHVFAGLSHAINTYMWDQRAGAYFNYDLRDGKLRANLNVTIFDPLRLAIAPSARRNRLLKRLVDPAQFNWGSRPLTSWSMTQPGFVEARGVYDGRAWFGDIWTLRNMSVVQGLEDSHRPDLAAELNWATIKEFHSNYREFVVPATGEGEGATNYAWSASQYIGAIIDHLFGIEYDAIEKRLRIAPHVPRELYGHQIAIKDLILPDAESRLSVVIEQSSSTAAQIKVRIAGKLPQGELLVSLPSTGKRRLAPMRSAFTAKFGGG
jgi:hypothetical protein